MTISAPIAAPPVRDNRYKMLDATIRRQPLRAGLAAQELGGVLSTEILWHIVRALRVPASRVYGVVTFYSFFSLEPKGEHTCVVCLGTACYVKGSASVLAAIESAHGIGTGATTAIRERETANWDAHTCRIAACAAAGCLSAGAGAVRTAIQDALTGSPGVRVIGTGCLGLCHAGPLVRMDRTGSVPELYARVTPEVAPRIAAHASGADAPVDRLYATAQPFFDRQQHIVLANAGRIASERVEDYIAAGGYTALRRAVSQMTPGQVIQQVTASDWVNPCPRPSLSTRSPESRGTRR
jgi:bidirectional [NiFe] hydrogenase diaphorase subunit